MFRRPIRILILFSLYSGYSSAQIDFSSIKSDVSVHNYSVIQYQSKPIGYNIVFRIADKNQNKLAVNFLDLNADISASAEIENAAGLHVIETAYNEEHFAVLFLNIPQKQLEVRLYSLKAIEVSRSIKQLTSIDLEYFTSKISQNSASRGHNNFLFEMGKNGFMLMYNTVEKNLNTCNISKIHIDSSQERFYNFVTDLTIFQSKYLGTKNKKLFFSFEKAGTNNIGNAIEIVALGIDQFDPIFEIEQKDNSKKIFIPTNIVSSNTNSNLILHGRFYNSIADINNPYHDGVGFWEITQSGLRVKENYIGFKQGFTDLKFNDKNKASDLGFLFTHEAKRTTEGSIFLISEGYKKLADEGGVSVGFGMMSPMMMSGDRYLKIRTSDILISVFDSNFNYIRSYAHEKASNTKTIGYYEYGNIYQLGAYFNQIGYLDFLYSEIDEKDENINIYYKNHQTSRSSTIRINKLTISDQDPIVKTIEKRFNTFETFFLPRSFGKMTIMEFVSRKKTMYFEFKQ
jgi:hypothetical protein